MGGCPASMLRTVMVRHGRSVAGIPRFRDSMLPITAASITTWFDYFTREEEEEGGRERTIERGPQPSILTENSEQTSGRLDETAERHETEGKRKWQGLSEGASTPFPLPPPLHPPLVPTSPSFASGTEGGRAADKLRRGLGRGITLSFAFNVYSLRYLRISCFAVRVWLTTEVVYWKRIHLTSMKQLVNEIMHFIFSISCLFYSQTVSH